MPSLIQTVLHISNGLQLNVDFNHVVVRMTSKSTHRHGHGPFGWFDQTSKTGYYNETHEFEFPASSLSQNGSSINLPPIYHNVYGETEVFIELRDNSRAGRRATTYFTHSQEYINGYVNLDIYINGPKCQWSCFITSATLRSIGKKDRCKELTLFRQYRDNYLIERHPEFVDLYYQIAGVIVAEIDKSEKVDRVYKSIWNDHLKPCMQLIQGLKMEQAFFKYKKMLLELSDRFLIDESKMELRMFINRFVLGYALDEFDETHKSKLPSGRSPEKVHDLESTDFHVEPYRNAF